MAKFVTQQNNFTAGEWSPRALARTDLERYGNAAKVLLNAYPVVQGGARRRPGTLYRAAAKNANKKGRLVRFGISRAEAYVLEIGDLFVRVYDALTRTYTGVELVAPWTEAQLPDIDFTVDERTMYLVHPAVPMQRLRCIAVSTWVLEPVPFSVAPYAEVGTAPAVALTLSLATVGTGRTATAGAATWIATDVGRKILSGAGEALITAVVSTTVATIDITTAFAGTSLASGAWELDASPQALLFPSAKGPSGTTIELIGSLSRGATLSLAALTGTFTVTASAAVFVAGDVGKRLFGDSGGVATITTYTSPTQVTVATIANFLASSFVPGAWGIEASTWRSGDIGKIVRINGGICRIAPFSFVGPPSYPASAHPAVVLQELAGTVLATPLSWSLEDAAWSAAQGYPRAVTMWQQRLLAGGTTKKPMGVWGSAVGDPLDHLRGDTEDSAFFFGLVSDEADPISYLIALRDLMAHTDGAELSLQGGVEQPISAVAPPRVRPESPHGAARVRPARVDSDSVFVQATGRKVRALGYRYDFDAYKALDLTALADHITASGITELAYQQEPDPLLLARRADGSLATCTIDRDQGVLGWALQQTDGAFESACSVSVGDREEVWCIVRRTVNAAVVRYLETFDDTFAPILTAAPDPNAYPPVAQPTVYGCTVDCGATFENVAGLTTISLPHLVGKEIDIVADGIAQARQTVPAGGTVTLARTAYRVLAGLPFTTRIRLLTPEVAGAGSTAQSSRMRVSEVRLRLLNTIGGRLFSGDGTEQLLPVRATGDDVLDAPPVPLSEDVVLESLGWDRGQAECEIVQDRPYPLHVLSVIRKITVNE